MVDYIPTPEIRRNKHKESTKKAKRSKRKEKKFKLTQKRASGKRANQVPREQGCCWLVRSALCPAGAPAEGRHKNTRQNNKQRDKELTQNGQSTNGQLVGQGYYCLSMKPGSMSRMLRCALQIFFISSIMSLDSMSPPFSSARYARQ